MDEPVMRKYLPGSTVIDRQLETTDIGNALCHMRYWYRIAVGAAFDPIKDWNEDAFPFRANNR
jgi:hypothetical protein